MLCTRSPLRQTRPYGLRNASLDLHALGAPPAFVLSQDQTLQRQFFGRHGVNVPRRYRSIHAGLNSVNVRGATAPTAPRSFRLCRIRGSIPGRRIGSGDREYIPLDRPVATQRDPAGLEWTFGF